MSYGMLVGGIDRGGCVERWRDLAVLRDWSGLHAAILADLWPAVRERLRWPRGMRRAEVWQDAYQGAALGLWGLVAVEGVNWSAEGLWERLFVFLVRRAQREVRQCYRSHGVAAVYTEDGVWLGEPSVAARVPACLEDAVFNSWTADPNLVRFRRMQVRSYLAGKIREGLSREAAIARACRAFDVEEGEGRVVRGGVTALAARRGEGERSRGFRRLRRVS